MGGVEPKVFGEGFHLINIGSEIKKAVLMICCLPQKGR
jgi:hypothetical protein